MARDWTVTLRIDTSAWSANREYPVLNMAAMGHAWLTVTAPNGERVDVGYYPRDGGLAGVGQLPAMSHTSPPRMPRTLTTSTPNRRPGSWSAPNGSRPNRAGTTA
jgi:hypothetical protein